MISIDEIDKSILELESRDTTYAVCERLAWLYIVRDHLAGKTSLNLTSSTGSEFSEAACSCDPSMLLSILEEHFDALKTLYPREYETLIAKMKSVR